MSRVVSEQTQIVVSAVRVRTGCVETSTVRVSSAEHELGVPESLTRMRYLVVLTGRTATVRWSFLPTMLVSDPSTSVQMKRYGGDAPETVMFVPRTIGVCAESRHVLITRGPLTTMLGTSTTRRRIVSVLRQPRVLRASTMMLATPGRTPRTRTLDDWLSEINRTTPVPDNCLQLNLTASESAADALHAILSPTHSVVSADRTMRGASITFSKTVSSSRQPLVSVASRTYRCRPDLP